MTSPEKPSMPARTLRSPSRRTVLRAAGAGLVGIAASPARGQGAWWENFFDSTVNKRHEASIAKQERAAEALNDLRPDSVPFRSETMIDSMEAAVGRYQQIVSRGGWPMVPTGRLLRAGDSDERVDALRRRLVISGHLHPRHADSFGSYNFDGHLEAALRQFQESHGLRVSARIDQASLAQLNIPATVRLEQLKLNQRRMRDLMQGRIEDRYVLVNVAAFQLEAVEGHEVRLRHRVIVGKPDRQTPSVKATIRALNFFPYWRVPDSVASLDLVPRLQKEPDYLQKEQIRVFQGYGGPEISSVSIDWRQVDTTRIKFRQDPGPQNALGLVRIDMPNEHTVYMHDTPLKPLFNQRGRAFSAGCVRVQDVFKLAEWIARFENGWEQPGRAETVVNSGQPLDVTLTRPLPVYFAYLTAWAERDGRVEFRPDIYGRDGLREPVAERDPDAPPPPSGGLAP